jgi:hypothetical protein
LTIQVEATTVDSIKDLFLREFRSSTAESTTVYCNKMREFAPEMHEDPRSAQLRFERLFRLSKVSLSSCEFTACFHDPMMIHKGVSPNTLNAVEVTVPMLFNGREVSDIPFDEYITKMGSTFKRMKLAADARILQAPRYSNKQSSSHSSTRTE